MTNKRLSPSLSVHRRRPINQRSSLHSQPALHTVTSVFAACVAAGNNWMTSSWHDLQQSALIVTSPSNVDDYFTCYDDVPRLLLDKYVPMKSVVVRRRTQFTVSMVRRRLSCYETQKPTTRETTEERGLKLLTTGLPKNRNPRNLRNLRNPQKSTKSNCLKIEIHKVHEIHSNATSAKYRNPRNPQTVRNPHWQFTNQQA